MKKFSRFIVVLYTAVLQMVFISLSAQVEQPGKEKTIVLSSDKLHDMTLEVQTPGEYKILTTGTDPYLFTEKLTEDIRPENSILTFEYFSAKGLDNLQVFFGGPVDENKSIHTELGLSEGWTTFSLDVKEQIKGWGKAGDFLRFDFGTSPNYRMQVRNISFRKPTSKEIALAASKEKNKMKDEKRAANLENYLHKKFTHSITDVSVAEKKVIVKTTVHPGKQLYLAELPLYQDITERILFDRVIMLPPGKKEAITIIDRFVGPEGKSYDRLLSKWVIVEKSGNQYTLVSHARYPDKIKPVYNLAEEKPWNKKGIGGFSAGGRAPVSDLDSLNISSVTINILITRFVHSVASENTINYNFNGKQYAINRKAVEDLDKTLRLTASRKIIVSGIILIGKASGAADKEIGRIFEHPDFDPAGIYSMANVTSAEGIAYYAAIMDFLCERYSRPDKMYGRIHHWIMHNEVDAGWVWTNMGEKPPLLFMDDYIKSMRVVYNIARKYNQHAKVFISLTHFWTWTEDRHFYHPKELLEILLRYSKAEGDFDWAIAQHPYPESLFEPKSWLDKRADFSFNTQLITYKNIEVLNAWVNQPATFYLGRVKRVIHLSEQGVNSMDYSEKSLQEQAAGMAYAWKKIKNLENIEAFQYHNWMDNRGEGGLRIGLRRFPDDETDPAGKKPVWNVYRDMGTDKEEQAFEFAKKIIGINSWDEVIYKGDIDSGGMKQAFKDIEHDTWVATDAFGRNLVTSTQKARSTKNRNVGIFYFLTHNDPGKPGPSDVTKIKAANPANPQWGTGTHYWGEPGAGYYLSTDEAVIREHAHLLSDAGIDVIIFDCTNNITYPEVTRTIFRVFRQIRAEGERTPAIAFLASEKSVYQVWDQLYSRGLYADLWFYWKGRPLLLFGQWSGIKPMNEVTFPPQIKSFFNLRYSWAWTTLPWYRNEGKDMWPWIDHYPQQPGWHESKATPEYIPVAVAEHPLSNIGRSFHKGAQPVLDSLDLTPYTDYGLFFQEQWNHAIEVDPEFVFVTGWNEWTAGKQVMKEDIEGTLKTWDFFPGATLGKLGKPLKAGDVYFIDQYNKEYSRDIEPMKEGYTDSYYYQLMNNVRRYKGVRKPEAAMPASINIKGDFKQWYNKGKSFFDHKHDNKHRDSPGNFKAGPYINTTGRNDILLVKVTHDQKNIYFYIETKDNLTSWKDTNWMLLFINTDQNNRTGWEGFDFLVNFKVISENTSTVTSINSKGEPGTPGNVSMKLQDNKLMLEIPRNLLKETREVSFDFHVADNIQKLGEIEEFFRNGDSAPSRRASYRYQEFY